MFTVALIGPDGSGKTTISRHLEQALAIPVKYLYMGVSFSSSNITLPTTRLIYSLKKLKSANQDKTDRENTVPPTANDSVKKSLPRRLRISLKSAIRLVIRLSEEWYRQGLSTYYKYRGYVVIFDRHFIADYYGFDITDEGQPETLSRRIHGFMLKHLYPRPDLVIYLDAPGIVLFERKGEKTPEQLEDRRQKYLTLCSNTKDCNIVDATQPAEAVIEEVTRLIMSFHDRCLAGK